MNRDGVLPSKLPGRYHGKTRQPIAAPTIARLSLAMRAHVLDMSRRAAGTE
jgi:hypothetical protein